MVVSNLLVVLRRAPFDQEAVIALEYALLGVLIIVVCAATIGAVGSGVFTYFNSVAALRLSSVGSDTAPGGRVDEGLARFKALVPPV